MAWPERASAMAGGAAGLDIDVLLLELLLVELYM